MVGKRDSNMDIMKFNSNKFRGAHNQVISQIMNPLVIYLFHFISSGRIWIGVDLSGLGIERVVKLGRFVYFLSKIKFMTSIRNKLSPCQRVEVCSLFFLYLVVYYCTGL